MTDLPVCERERKELGVGSEGERERAEQRERKTRDGGEGGFEGGEALTYRCRGSTSTGSPSCLSSRARPEIKAVCGCVRTRTWVYGRQRPARQGRGRG